jgi:hypothetical protein
MKAYDRPEVETYGSVEELTKSYDMHYGMPSDSS